MNDLANWGAARRGGRPYNFTAWARLPD